MSILYMLATPLAETTVDPGELIKRDHMLSWFTQSGSTMSSENDILYNVIVYACLFWFFLLVGCMVWFTIKYRRRPGVPTQRSPSHNTALELAWSVIPLLKLVVFFVWGFNGFMKQFVAPAGAEEIYVTGKKWSWTATYPNGRKPSEVAYFMENGAVKVPIIHVPADRPVKLILKSDDVIHAFGIPDFRHKVDVMPNRYTSLWFEATEPGRQHIVFCSEYCGENHSEMAAILNVVDWDTYQEKINAPLDLGGKKISEIGELLMSLHGCGSCHNADGSESAAAPSWKTQADGQYGWGTGRTFADGTSMATVDEDYLRESILYSQAKIVEGYPTNMPTYAGSISDEEVSLLIMYMKYLASGQDEVYEPETAEGDTEGEPAP